ncbi:MAG: tryptophan synthase subunit alpha [Candidatus Omnitrophica bacterium]|nr:tryptophan synthase subunit alpha [Candidatus Omnitrophota bacterium]
MNRFAELTARLKRKRKKAFVVYLTAGFPDIAATRALLPRLQAAGADCIELGMPFSDPVADGATIQHASQEALRQGMTVRRFLELVKSVRARITVPLIMMTYYNPLLQYGLAAFVAQARECGLDGIIVPDLPPEESGALLHLLKPAGIAQIFLVSPLSDAARIRMIARACAGFIYYVPLTGVTGARAALAAGYAGKIRAIKAVSPLPVYVGFGVSQPEQVRRLAQAADGVIVGSALLDIVRQTYGSKNFPGAVERFVTNLNAQTFE